MDGSDPTRSKVTALLVLFVKRQLLSPHNFVQPVYMVAIEFLDDLAIDIPTVHKNLAQVLAPLIDLDVVQLATLAEQCRALQPGSAKKLFTQAAALVKDPARAAEATSLAQ